MATNGDELDRHRSRFAARARALDPTLLGALRVTDVMITLCDVVVTVCRTLSDESDPRPWQERLDSCFTVSLADIDHDSFVKGLDGFARGDDGASITEWIKRTKKVGYIAFARRILGAAEFDRLEAALREDAAVVVLALRRGLRAAMPFGVAWEDAVAVMSVDQLRAVSVSDRLAVGVLKLLVDLDRSLGEKLLPELPMELTSATTHDLAAVDDADLESLGDRIRLLVSADSAKRVRDVNSYLGRKITGARHALEHSDDGVSQAANSMIELIDRLLRESFDRTFVLNWVDVNLPDESDLTYERDGSRLPTKRAEALCAVYSGGAVAREPTGDDDGKGPTLVHDVLSRAIVVAREKLQRLKHADTNDENDRETMRALIASIDGTLMLALRLGWAIAPDSVQVEQEGVLGLPATASRLHVGEVYRSRTG